MNKKFLLCFLAIFASGQMKGQTFSVRTNAVGLCTGNLNLEPSFAWGKSRRWSAQLPLQFNPFIGDDNKKFLNFTIQPGVRYWLLESYVKTFVGANLIYSNYHMGNIFNNKYRYEGKAFGAGISLGYAKPIFPKWNIEVEAGIGMVKADYTKYLCKKCGKKIGDYNRFMVVPTKISASIVYLF